MKTDLTGTLSRRQVVSLNRTKILLMDADGVNQKLISKMLGKIGCSVVSTENHGTAVNLIESGDIDLILLDVHLYNSNGFDIAGVIRKKEESSGKRIPIVALADNELKRNREKCMADGLDECLPKPVFENELSRVVGKLAGNCSGQPDKAKSVHPK
jgi:two-component system sensor histidine kinase/response regulator